MPLNNRAPKGGSSAEKKCIIANEACKIVWHVLCMLFLSCFDMAEVAYWAEKFLKNNFKKLHLTDQNRDGVGCDV